jgi:radical SAM superfamily enzyme with C-terminal helix-hairpin-helix motif
VGANDEQERMLAVMALVRAGDRSIHLIESAIDAGSASPQAVRLLADIGGEQARSVLSSTAASKGPLESAANEALEMLNRIDQLDDEV